MIIDRLVCESRLFLQFGHRTEAERVALLILSAIEASLGRTEILGAGIRIYRPSLTIWSRPAGRMARGTVSRPRSEHDWTPPWKLISKAIEPDEATLQGLHPLEGTLSLSWCRFFVFGVQEQGACRPCWTVSIILCRAPLDVAGRIQGVCCPDSDGPCLWHVGKFPTMKPFFPAAFCLQRFQWTIRFVGGRLTFRTDLSCSVEGARQGRFLFKTHGQGDNPRSGRWAACLLHAWGATWKPRKTIQGDCARGKGGHRGGLCWA